MPRIYTSIHIPIPVETVFNYITTPGNWPKWHPSSLEVSGDTDHSLEVGEQTTEQFLVSGRRGMITWTVRERVFPQHWVIEGKIAGRSTRGIVSYTTNAQDNGTFFEREFIYTIENPLLMLLDRLLIRRNVEAESRQALQQLKQVLTQQYSSANR